MTSQLRIFGLRPTESGPGSQLVGSRSSLPMALVAALVMLGRAAALPAQGRLGAGAEGELEVPGCRYPCTLYVPTDYKPGRRLPLIFFMHDAGGSPTSGPWLAATGGRGYFVVGLSYGGLRDNGAGGILGPSSECVAMLEFTNRVRDLVDRTYGIDQKSVFLTGQGMGGSGVGYFGCLPAARGLYRGHVIIGIAPEEGPSGDFGVARGLPVLLVAGGKDQNRPLIRGAADELRRAGANVEEVVIPGDGRIPSDVAMKPHLKKWLERIWWADLRTGYIAAGAWTEVRPEGTSRRDLTPNASFGEFLRRQEFIRKAPEGRPLLVFAHSHREPGLGRKTPAAAASEAVDQGVLSFPQASGTPVALRQFSCFRLDLTEVDAKADPNLNESSAPLVFLLAKDHSLAAVLKKDRLRDDALVAEMKKLLDPGDVEAITARTADVAPILMEFREVQRKREAALKALSALRSKGQDSSAREEELAELDAQYDALRERLLQ